MWTIENEMMQPLAEAETEGEALALLVHLGDPRLSVANRAHCARRNETLRVHTAERVRETFIGGRS